MAKKIEYNKEKIWAKIEADQNRKRRKRLLPLFFLSGLAIVGFSIFSLLPPQQETTNVVNNLPHKGKEKMAFNSHESKVISEDIPTSGMPKEASTATAIKKETVNKINETPSTTTAILPKTTSSITQQASHYPQYTQPVTTSQSSFSSFHQQPSSIILSDTDAAIDNSDSALLKHLNLASLSDIATHTLALESKVELYKFPMLDRHSIVQNLSKSSTPLLKSTSLYLQNALFFSDHLSGGTTATQQAWNNSQSLNFGTSTTAGVEVLFSKNVFLRAGLGLSILSTTYRHDQVTLEEGISQNDTLVVYSNFVETGDRKTTTTTTRSIVKNNETYKVGVPIALGYTINRRNFDLKIMLQSTFNFYQKFSGVMNDESSTPLFNSAAQNDYFSEGISVDHSATILIGKTFSKRWGWNLGMNYAFSPSRNGQTSGLTNSNQGLGLVTGFSFNLR